MSLAAVLLGRSRTALSEAAGGCGALQQLLSQQHQPAAAALPCHHQQRLAQHTQHHHHHHHQQQQQQQQLRCFSSSRAAGDLTDFMDLAYDRTNVSTGRAWLAKELRNKSFDDLHKLWYVCLKERNMLLTQIAWAQAEQRRTQQGNRLLGGYISRIQHVKKTMNRIKQVLSERAHNEADAVKSLAMKRVIHWM